MNAAEKARLAREQAMREEEVEKENLEATRETEKVKSQIRSFASKQKWDIVTFGNYIDKSGRQPIEWLVLDKCGDEITLVSKNLIDTHGFCETLCTSWKDSDIRAWLNDEFMNRAFTKTEQKFLSSQTIESDYGMPSEGKYVTTTDKVYLLSRRDFVDQKEGKGFAKLFSKTTKDMLLNCKPTQYVEGKGICKDGNNSKYSCWWTRDMESQRCEIDVVTSPGKMAYIYQRLYEGVVCSGVIYAGNNLYVALHESNRYIDGTREKNKDLRTYRSFGVRPVITLKID